MKRALLYMVLSVLFFYSCKKDHSAGTAPSSKTYPVNFTVSGASQITGSTGKLQINGLKTDAQTSLAGYMDILYYYVLDANGNVVHALREDSTQTNFGTISDQLPAGTYTVVMVAGKKGLIYNNGNSVGAAKGSFLIYYDLTSGFQPWLDTFYTKFSLTVTNVPISQNVALSRRVGQIEVEVQDTIPATANS
ncbi:MAG TPA: FimB/Mfa2 family fimbrial subunit, partial [Mucilaginibacter sp.]|nr:FimB/Mfa2 family fimbrial subunit [Mucilaginibacter sp.]